MHSYLPTLQLFDPQLTLFFDKRVNRWIVYRMPDVYGKPPKDMAHDEADSLRRDGRLLQVLVCERDGRYMEPYSWVEEYLKARDIRKVGKVSDWLREIDEHNARVKQKIRDEGEDRLRYRIGEDWQHIRDELRGDNKIFRKYTQSFDKSWDMTSGE